MNKQTEKFTNLRKKETEIERETYKERKKKEPMKRGT